MQEFKGVHTSINSTRVPALFKKAPITGIRNLDIGGGKFNTATKYLKEKGIDNLIFDPFNRSVDHNLRVIMEVACEPADTATISNVLNIIKEKNKRIEALQRASRWAKVTFITVYEGNKSGIGNKSKKGCWQNNWRIDKYIPEVQEVFRNVEVLKNGVIKAYN